MYLDRQTLTNSIDPGQTPQNAASDQGLHCLQIIQYIYTHSQTLSRFVEKYKVKSKGENYLW